METWGLIREPPSNSNSPPLYSVIASIAGNSVPEAKTPAKMARTVANSGRLYIANAQRLEEFLLGRPHPPVDWTIPSHRRLVELQRYYSYHPRGYGRIRLDRLGTSPHFPIEIDDSDSEGVTAQNPIVIEDDDSDTDEGGTAQDPIVIEDTDGSDGDDSDTAGSAMDDSDTDDDADRDPSDQGVGEATEEN